MTNSIQLTIEVEETLKQEFFAAAASAQRPPANVLQDLIQEYVNRQKDSTAYQQFLQEKVAVARQSVRQGSGQSNAEVEKTYAALRQKARSGA